MTSTGRDHDWPSDEATRHSLPGVQRRERFDPDEGSLARPQRCMYCMKAADVAIHDGRGRTVFACEEHMTQAVDGIVKPPQVIRLDTHQEVPIKVRWYVEGTHIDSSRA